MFEICGATIYTPLKMFSGLCIGTNAFPSEWKNGSIVPLHKKRRQANIEKLSSSVAATHLWENS